MQRSQPTTPPTTGPGRPTRDLETVRAVREEVRRIRGWIFHLQRHRE